ncbi:membrane dipeptidase [Pimelobacter simplex]|uniref:Putative dipeptidase n=1 Tax=Nocardioides simplex TaxID=2045 RepID=A0A0A1DH86_NOCSI|nr:dipeptidase [Pimelobacter simplex]AIY15957.1 putative dipeptidase [Pimelobacter simplex]MCG8150930.1 membrane dipeptidase [Pimelobacter simplex]GEB12436.1 dipeptidase [Pimelobacter simplex]SFM95082.1 membrane dipeptidase [Pimelobacter simplex]
MPPNDLAFAARERLGYSVEGLDRGSPLQTDIDRLRQGGVGGQFWSVFAPSELPPVDTVQYTLEQIDFVYRLIARYPETFRFARTGDDVRRSWDDGKVASLIGAEGGNSIGGSLAVLRVLARLGLRYMTLTRNYNVDWADSATDEPVHHGLSDFGRDVVREMNRLGVLVDLSHVSADTMRDAISVSQEPVIFSHSSCFSVCAHPRNVPDDVLASLSGNGGVVMVAFVPQFVDADYHAWFDGGGVGTKPRVTVQHVADHVDHAREVAGLEHIGFGSDYDGCDDFPVDMADVVGFAPLLDELATRGWSAPDLAKLMGGNVLRVLDETSAASVGAIG